MRYPLNRPRVKVGFGFGDAWFNTGKLHTGEDDQAAAGEAVFAPADGIVYNHTYDPKWGNGVVMEFDSGGEGCCIWHVDHLVADGSHVLEGQQIATVYNLQGNTHLHLSFWVGKYDENLRAGALFPAVWPDRFVEPDHYLDSHPDQPHLPDTGHPLMEVIDVDPVILKAGEEASFPLYNDDTHHCFVKVIPIDNDQPFNLVYDGKYPGFGKSATSPGVFKDHVLSVATQQAIAGPQNFSAKVNNPGPGRLSVTATMERG